MTEFINCKFIQVDEDFKEGDPILTPGPSDTFTNCTFHVKRNKAAINFTLPVEANCVIERKKKWGIRNWLCMKLNKEK